MRMKRFILSLVAMIGVGLVTVVPVQGHHSFAAEFDANRPITLRGTIARVEFTNPHGWLYLDVKKTDGQVQRWEFELASSAGLARRGFGRDSVKIGTEITVTGYLAKGVPFRGAANTVQYPDGRSLFLGSSGTGAPYDQNDPSKKK